MNSDYPVADKIPFELKKHDDIRIDNYFWMKDRENPKVREYLIAENEYCDSKMAHTKKVQTELFEEMKSRIKEDDSSVPYKYNGYWYITRFEKGKDYPIYTRKKEILDNPEELLFDCNEMAIGKPYFKLAGISISPDNELVSYGVDETGRRQYTIQIKNLKTGEVFSDKIENTTGSSSWANDNKTIFYTKKDSVTLRAHQIYRHTLGQLEDKLIFEEGDETFGVTVYKTKSRKYIVIACYSTLTNEYHILEADSPKGKFKLFQERIRGLEYSISHYNNHFYILTNKDRATNFKIMKTPVLSTGIDGWEELISHREDTLIENVDIFKDYLVISERRNGLNQIRIKRWDNKEDYYLPFDNETYTCYTTTNIDFDTDTLRYGYNALTTPSSIIEFNMQTKSKTILKEQEVLGGTFKKENYVSERIWAVAEDGTKIPISIVYRKGLVKHGKNPLLQYAYGSYGSTVDPYFSTIRLSLLDRGFIYAIAHVRGGEYLGRKWYEDGKLLKKKNSFSDFIACSIQLIKDGYTSSKHLYAMGGSAGGLLIGAVINEAPELYNGVIAAVPFVDVVTTMLDDSIPLTTGEYDEWGNPNDKLYYNYMKSYSPYDNVEEKAYPNILVTSGLHDSQVQYWEPTKWVAKLRELKTNDKALYLRTNMDAGHGGASGRFESLKEDAEEFAFLLDLEGINS
ncbi:S9 family peptidase [Winogradskyella alexanderae]|uniref:S9 family peptidase n=1 Tax=Winogradskyella alexanderae TaxID=2877123 RepID=A0ABS7XTX9_9FLAO|nr:S9 family peptidase [Winogradskyella alexanderae]MCA0133480.1 S9 family peptidase [Winogradskyella alexanderae]